MSDYDSGDVDLSNADLIAKYRTCKLKEVNADLLLDRLEAAVAEIDRLVATGLANVETTGKAARFLADLDKVEAEIAQWKAVAAGYCEQLAEAKAQLLKMEAAQCSVTNLIQGRINLLDTEKDAEIDRLKELVRFCWQLNDENYALLTEPKKAEILAIVLEMEAK